MASLEQQVGEGGRHQGLILEQMPVPWRLPSGRFALTMVELLERAGQDTRMGRSVSGWGWGGGSRGSR